MWQVGNQLENKWHISFTLNVVNLWKDIQLQEIQKNVPSILLGGKERPNDAILH
jgi:hypothetical protein